MKRGSGAATTQARSPQHKNDPAPHVAFGHRPHICPGCDWPGWEAAVALHRLFAALPDDITSATPADALPYRPGLLVRGPHRLTVRRRPDDGCA
ncbi:hypothetical protein ACH4RA_08945 [Streptomyces smyrnaeus]|uniref:hypothetical protein n=1 Tax=Streptomyces TaxID=1883 RepID=UPI00117E7C45|nr:hypothetical protein [Streptomyces sp. RK75]MBQ0864675.1 hypothetical protein [Streptomyces sp. RK75]MBQ1156675.1 hypothetical protein [Streptomyces sp. A73]